MDVRLLELEDVDALHAYHVRNAEHLRPWNPTPPPDALERSRYAALLTGHLVLRASGMEYRFGAFREGRLMGQISLVNVERGGFQNGRIGYSTDAEAQGRGVASVMIASVCRYAFETLGLHRLEANVMPRNAASRRALEKNGFVKVGFSPCMIQIAGVWEDHDMFMRLAEGTS